MSRDGTWVGVRIGDEQKAGEGRKDGACKGSTCLSAYLFLRIFGSLLSVAAVFLSLLCDEPTGALDYKNSKGILRLLEAVNREFGMIIVLVTHIEAFSALSSGRDKEAVASLVSVPLAKKIMDYLFPYLITNFPSGMEVVVSPVMYAKTFALIIVTYLLVSLVLQRHLAGCAFARKPIGFDLEHRRDGIAWADLLRWTQKESLGKYSGRGVFADAGEKPAGIGYTRISVREGYLGMLCSEAGCSLSTHWSDLSGLLEGSC